MALLSRIMAFALKNAVEYKGKASFKAVVSKVFSGMEFEIDDYKFLKRFGCSDDEEVERRDVAEKAREIVEKVNTLTIEEQRKLLESFVFPGEKGKGKGKGKGEASLEDLLPPLPSPEKVVTRLPPEPNGYLHIGHAKAAFIDYVYAKKYNGRFLLRFDDTNPLKEEKIYYDAQKEDLKWLGIEWDEELCTSDDIELLYDYASQLIQKGDAYVCTCTPEQIKEGRSSGTACSCRNRNRTDNETMWKDLLAGRLKGILRLKGDMESNNTAFRDPTLFRIIEKEHPRQGKKYRVWPTYDFSGAIEDSIHGVTHAFRTKEYELRDRGYFKVLDCLGLRRPILMEFSRLEIKHMPVSKRVLKPWIDKGLVKGWSDIRLPTLRALRRRGIKPEAIEEFVLKQGFSKAEAKPSMEILEAINRKLVDSKAKRYFFVPDPVKLIVKNAPEITAKIRSHPTQDLGTREVKTKGTFYVDKNDVKENEEIRLKELYNAFIDKIEKEKVHAHFSSMEMKGKGKKIQWVTEDHLKTRVIRSHGLLKDNELIPLEITDGLLEREGEKIKEGEIVQFERFGFCRKNEGMFCFTHR